jgi:hypothetical protein
VIRPHHLNELAAALFNCVRLIWKPNIGYYENVANTRRMQKVFYPRLVINVVTNRIGAHTAPNFHGRQTATHRGQLYVSQLLALVGFVKLGRA